MQLETIDRGEQLVAVARRRLHQRCGTAEGNDAYIDVRRAILDECLGCALCRGDPIGVDITGAHAERDVHRKDDGLAFRGQRDHRRRIGAGDDQGDLGQQKQQRRDVAPEALGRSDRFLDQIDTRIPDDMLLLAPEQRDVRRDERRREEQEPQDLRVQKLHALMLRRFAQER